ncbi:MAG: SPOR domain-containing protein [Nitrospinae bacterium]|nr:SPOR domain-containing protein [Nitrospinota bacterium]
MLYQTLKFYFARLTVSLFLIVGIGFSSLYFIHEVALPNVVFDDVAIQWTIFLVCLFFGFIGYGMLGEQGFYNSLHGLKNISPKAIVEDIKSQFEDLIKFTYSSYFLPAKGKRYRNLGVLQFADYLLSIGDESPSALNIYVQAFIQSPQNTRFRKPLLSILNRGEELNQQEMDLLLIMFQQEEKHDPVLTSYLAQLFLKAKQWSGQTESLFLSALEEKNKLSEDIAKFSLPIYLAHQRKDERALRFYIRALDFSVPEEEQIKTILGQSFCDWNLVGVAPDLHRKCEEIFYQLDEVRQAELKSKSDEDRISYKLQKIKLFRREDLQDLKRLKVEMGLVASKVSLLWKGLKWFGVVLRKLGKWILLRILDAAYKFGNLSFKIKLGSFAVLSIFIVIGLSFKGVWLPIEEQGTQISNQKTFAIPESGESKKEKRVYTVQIAAVVSAKQANRMVKKLKKKKVDNLYVVKSQRRSGGHWYKLRVGQFSSKREASEFANQLVAVKTVKNYFIISLPKK